MTPDRHDRIRHFLARPGYLRRELANARRLPSEPPAGQPGAAYLDGMLFRGTQDGRVLAYDFKTGKRIWEATIADPKRGESVSSAPIAWDGLVFVGNAGGDFKGGKGRMYALDAKTGKIVWEFFLVPKAEGDVARGPLGATPLNMSTWQNAPGIPISGGGPGHHTPSIRRPGGCTSRRQSGSRLRNRRARGRESLYRLGHRARRQDRELQHHFKIVPKDWHDWDVSNPPVLIQTMGGKQLMWSRRKMATSMASISPPTACSTACR